MNDQRAGFWRRIAPALTLALLAPVVAEVLPGATRFSSIFVFPIEICVWGMGAVLIREAVRRWQMDWRGLVCLALALSIAEEFLIQQTSAAPMVIHLKGVVYARALGINYVYLLWALVYEAVFVVVVPVALAELMFSQQKKDRWLNGVGLVMSAVLFFAGALLAWFTWTHIARTKVFHLPMYRPPLATTLLACAVMAVLFVLGFGRRRTGQDIRTNIRPSTLAPWLLASGGLVWAILLYGIVLLAFGIAPWFPPAATVAAAVVLGLTPLIVFFRSSGALTQPQIYWLASGTITGAALAGFVGFIGALRSDLIFKIAADAIFLMILIGLKTKVASTTEVPNSISECR